jgi:hypothetical protein
MDMGGKDGKPLPSGRRHGPVSRLLGSKAKKNQWQRANDK